MQMNEPRIIKLPRNGPKPGQSVSAWLHGKDKSEQEEIDRLRWQRTPDNKKAS
jgi:hypothetical protein